MQTNNHLRSDHSHSSLDDIEAAHAAVRRLAAESAEIGDALDRGRRQLQTTIAKLRDLATNGPDGDQAAEALLAGSVVTADDEDAKRLGAEREAVQNGIAALNRRRAQVEQELDAAQAELRTALASAVDPIAADICARAGKALVDLAQAFADAEVLHAATRNLRCLELTTTVRGFLFRAAVEKLVVRTSLRPSDDVLAALPGPELVKAAGGHLPAVIDWPSHP